MTSPFCDGISHGIFQKAPGTCRILPFGLGLGGGLGREGPLAWRTPGARREPGGRGRCQPGVGISDVVNHRKRRENP